MEPEKAKRTNFENLEKKIQNKYPVQKVAQGKEWVISDQKLKEHINAFPEEGHR